MLGRIRSVYRRNSKYLSTAPLVDAEIEKTKIRSLTKEYNNKLDIPTDPDFFNVYQLFTVKDLFDSMVHYGHKMGSLNDQMKPFVYGSRMDHVIFDLDITAALLRDALNFTAHIAYRRGIILFISRNPRTTLLVENTAKECKEYACSRQWRKGTFLESKIVFRKLTRLPDLCIILNTTEENGLQHDSIVEAAKLCIPTVGIVDSNCDPRLITYPVPGNDDSPLSVNLYCKLFKAAIMKGKEKIDCKKEASETVT